MAINLDVTPLPPFDCSGDPTSVGPRWKRWKKAFQFYVDGKGIENNNQKRALLLHSAGMDVQDIFETLTDVPFAPLFEGDTDNVYKQAMRKLDGYFTPKGNVPYERHIFRSLKQDASETVDQYVSRLKKQALNCEFGDEAARSEMIRDQVIDACQSSHLRKKLLQKGDDLTLDTVLETARALEAVELQSKRIEARAAEVNRISSRPQDHKQSHTKRKPENNAVNDGKCFRCGRSGHFSKDLHCPARKDSCRKCGHTGHWAIVCKTKIPGDKNEKAIKPGNKGGAEKGKKKPDKVNHVYDQGSDDEYAFSLNNAAHDSGMVDIKVGGVMIRALIDSGSTANVVDQYTWKYLKQHKIVAVLERTNKRLYPYGSRDPLSMIGKFTAITEVGKQQIEAEFLIIEGQGHTIVSKETAEKLGVLRIGPKVYTMAEKLTAEDIQKQYPNVCNGIGKLKNYQAKIHIDPNVTPVAQHTRRIPFAMHEKLEAKIHELLRDDIIEPVEGPTPWLSPLVIIPKPSGDIRICVDMRQANTAVIRERHPIPTVDEVIQRMNGSTVFTKLDLQCGFHQLELEEKSREITTFVCHLGIFRYKRLMFGISSAPELFQHIIHQVMSECEGVENISDDLIVHGNGDSEHDARLVKCIETLMKHGLTINIQKCLIRLPELEYFGHHVSGSGISPTEDRVRAVIEARMPKTASEVRSFLGLVNFSARFIPNLAIVAEPLRKLTRSNEKFIWGPEQDCAFETLKMKLSNIGKLAHFQKGAPTEIVVDASPVGLGAILVQEQAGEKRVVCYASRSLSQVERRYSQTEREALGIVWACERFHQYLYGIHFEIVTDHKPLLYIYSVKSKPSARIERWVLRLQPYDFSVKHIPGREMVADALSRLVKETNEQNQDSAEAYVRYIATAATPNALKTRDIERESENDDKLTVIRSCLRTGNWDKCPTEYKCVRNELCAVGKLVLRGCRIVIPESLREQVTRLAHEGHQGMVKTKQRLRTKVWWPRMDSDVEKVCKSCYGCQLVSKPSVPEPMRRTELPTQPWQHTAADLLGPMPGGEYIFAIVDYYSRYFDVDILTSVTSADIIRSCNKIFATHGYPLSLKTDNGKQLISQEFESYLDEHGIKHLTSPPLWPQANGEIERQNKTMLKAMRIAAAEGKDWKFELYKLLIAYRSTPHETTGVSPAKRMFRREIRTKLPEFNEYTDMDLTTRDRDAEQKQRGKDYADSQRKAKYSTIGCGDRVLMEQAKKDKLSTRYGQNPLTVVNRSDSKITVEADDGKKFVRNPTHLRKFVHPTTTSTDDTEQDNPAVEVESQPEPEPPPGPVPTTTRSGRIVNMPAKFKDFVLT